MNIEKDHSRYGLLLMSLHWIMLILLIAVFACIELHEFYALLRRKGFQVEDSISAH